MMREDVPPTDNNYVDARLPATGAFLVERRTTSCLTALHTSRGFPGEIDKIATLNGHKSYY